MAPSENVCLACGKSSEAWLMHRDRWWMRDEDGRYHWLDVKAGQWIRYRSGTKCPYCDALLAVNDRRCKSCGNSLNELEYPDPTKELETKRKERSHGTS